MQLDLSKLTAIYVAIIAFLETVQSCDLNCGPGYRCETVRSECGYPPCPHFPTCVPRWLYRRKHTDHHGHHRTSDPRRHHPHIHRNSFDEEQGSSVHVPRSGQCPVVTTTGPCIEACRTDGDCPANNKCCYNGCGNTCRNPTEAISEKPGTCPRHIRSMTSNCTEECDTDLDCPWVQKCCRSACGSHCTDPCYYWLPSNQRSARKSIIWKLPFMCRN